jgi:hypothetical protein
MAANGFPKGEREGVNQNASLDAIPEPLGDDFSCFYHRIAAKKMILA